MPDDEDDYESAFSLDGIPGVEEEETEEKGTEELEKITATLADFPVDNWNSKSDAKHIVDEVVASMEKIKCGNSE